MEENHTLQNQNTDGMVNSQEGAQDNSYTQSSNYEGQVQPQGGNYENSGQPQEGNYQGSGYTQNGAYQGSGHSQNDAYQSGGYSQDGTYQGSGYTQNGNYRYGGYQQNNNYPQNQAYGQKGYNNYNYQNYSGNYQPYRNMPPYGDSQLELEEPVKVGEWVLSMVLMMLPCVNIIMMFVWAFSSTEKKSKSNFFKAALIMYGVIGVLMVLLWMAMIISAAL